MLTTFLLLFITATGDIDGDEYLIQMEEGKLGKVMCSQCGIHLSNRYVGRRHFREKHLSNDPQMCTICFKNFPNKRYLSDHNNKVHKVPYKLQSQS